MKRLLGIDYGAKRVGVAISDPTGLLARALETQQGLNTQQLLEFIDTLLREYEVSAVVVGLPCNMNGTEGPMALRCREFAFQITERFGLPATLWDERLSSRQAEQYMLMNDMSRNKRRKKIDGMAAQIILQSYLDYRKTKNK